MAKRIADKELTDRNWDQEDEGEEAGMFSVASEDVLRNRPIKKAKRRSAAGEGEGAGSFKGFKGFSLTSPVSGGGGAAPFSGFGTGGGFKGLGGLTNGKSPAPSFGGFTASPGFNGSISATPAADGPAPPRPGGEYRRQLTALNCSVRDWISKHVNDNPLCDLNPIFRDYERHLASIERQYGAGAAGWGSEQGGAPSAAAPLPSPAPEDSAREKSAAGVTFNFGQKVDSSALGSKATPTTKQTTPFGSGSGTAPPEARPPAEENDEESDEPPKPEVKEVKEEEAFYSKKCKLFYKKDSEFKEKGVGTLHLKLTEEGRTQMLVRADTNLGNILLNIMAQSSMPCSRVGKNNVMVVCVPNPPVDQQNPGSPAPLLIRLKTAEDADELHGILEEKKG
ncbi:nuclear pore complex protein Nup50 [Brachionichthys hirsutus]|uniref:nuclear pore complex protein Nup50 n=1 Tax=Brachionichthys hirsutus TaxID=412623 RepID=UPI003604D97A